MEEQDYWLGFSVFSGIGPVKFKALLKHFGSAKASWEASTLEIGTVLGQVTTAELDTFRKEFSIEHYLKQLQKASVRFVSQLDEYYPTLLKQTPKAPIGLFVKGNAASLTADKLIAVVGTRKITNYGQQVTEMLTTELVQAGFTIVSGLAFGVDSVAHATTIDCNGKTIAVLGCGVDCCSPRENQRLYDSIVASGGCIVSEVPLGHEPTKGMFPSRNRIVAGMSVGVVVTEGAEDSGALITAEDGISFGRSVFAVPGPITSVLSKGPYKLIEKGAKLVTTGSDILNHLNVRNNKNGLHNQNISFASKEEELIGKYLVEEPHTFDQLVRKTGLDSAKIGAILSMMEIRGVIQTDTTGLYILKS